MPPPDAICLPFNCKALDGRFLPAVPGDPEPDGPGLWIAFQGDMLLLDASGADVSFIAGPLPDWAADCRHTALFIGSWEGIPVRILDVSKTCTIPSPHIAEPLLLTFFHERLPDSLLTLAGRAQQILAWERKNGICSRCGASTVKIPGTWGKKCRQCYHEHFPHIHPCTLVLVFRGNELLLIRKAEWPPGYYSLPSGFCDFGESLEECAGREVEEETGISIKNLRYVGSQSWPFPGQLMVGFVADYAGGEIVVDREELEDAAWFSQDRLPPTFSSKSIAGWMLEQFGRPGIRPVTDSPERT